MSATTIRTAVGTIVTGLGYRVALGSTFETMYATDSGIGVGVALDEAPGDEVDSVREYELTLRAFVLRGAGEAAARGTAETMAQALRAGILARAALAAGNAQVVEATSWRIQPVDDVMQIEQTYRLLAVSG